MFTSNSSSNSITNSTVSRESAPKSFTKDVSGVTFSLSTPSCVATISMTRSRTDATSTVLLGRNALQPSGIAGNSTEITVVPGVTTRDATQPLFKLNKIEEIYKTGQGVLRTNRPSISSWFRQFTSITHSPINRSCRRRSSALALLCSLPRRWPGTARSRQLPRRCRDVWRGSASLLR